MIATPRLVVSGHTQGDGGTVTVDAVVWQTTLSANRTMTQTITRLERELRALKGETR